MTNAQSNGPWTTDHPFQEILEQTDPLEILRMLEDVRRSFGERLDIISGPLPSEGAVFDLTQQVGLLLEKLFANQQTDNRWFEKPGTLRISPVTTRADTEDVVRLHETLASDIKEIPVPNNAAVKPLFRWMDERATRNEPHSFFIENIITHQ